MGDMGEYFNDLRKFRQEKRVENRKSSRDWLLREGIPFQERNLGAHLIVAATYDFWPGTGKWGRIGQHKSYRRGIRHLIAQVRKDQSTIAARKP